MTQERRGGQRLPAAEYAPAPQPHATTTVRLETDAIGGTADPLTPDRERALRAMLAEGFGPRWKQGVTRPALYDGLVDTLAEIDRLRGLPVIETCGGCGFYRRGTPPKDTCGHDACFDRPDPFVLAVQWDATPPPECPLRHSPARAKESR